MHTEQLSSLIRYHRKKAQLTQSELAELAGVSRTVVQDLETCKGRTTWGNLMSVLSILNISLQPVGPLVDQWKIEDENATEINVTTDKPPRTTAS